MASGAGSSSVPNHTILRRTSHLKRKTTMDTMTSLASTSTFSLRGSFKGARRTENLMRLIGGEKRNDILYSSSDANSYHRVRMSNNFAREHHYGVVRRKSELRFIPVRQSSLSGEFGAVSDQVVNKGSDRTPVTLSRHESLTFMKQDKRRRSILRRYSSLMKNSQRSRREPGSFYLLKHSTSFTSMSSSQSDVMLALLPPPKSKALERFRHFVRILRILIRAVTRAKDSAKNNFASITTTNEMAISSNGVQDVLLLAKAAAVKNSGLVFDLSVFKANKEQQISSDVKRILGLPPQERQEVGIQKALLNLRTAVDAFCEFPLMMQQSFVKLGWYESFEAKRVIIRQGYPAERYYFILSGTAMVSVITEDQKTRKCTIQPKALLRKGNSIGEDALMRNDFRDSTVIAETAVEVLMIEKDDFVKIYLPDPNGTEQDLVHFLSSVDCFSQWPVQVLRYDDPNHCLQNYFRRGSVVCKDARTSDWIYVIKTGSCRVVRRLRIPTSIYNGFSRACQYSSEINEKNGKCCGATGSTSSFTRNCNLSQRTDWWNDPAVLSTKSRPDCHGNPLPESAEENDDLYCHVFMQIQKLEEGDTFGVLPIVFPHEDDVTCDVTLVSDGAECVMIARRLYNQHLSENFIKFLQDKLRPWPTGHALQQQLREKINWQQFKCSMMYKTIESFSKLSLTEPSVPYNSQKFK